MLELYEYFSSLLHEATNLLKTSFYIPCRIQLKVEGKKPLTIKVCAGSTRKGSGFKGKFL